MRKIVRTQFLLTVLLVAFGGASELSGQSANAATKAACALLSGAELSKIAGQQYPEGSTGDAPGEGVGGGSSCLYGGATLIPGPHPPMLGLVFIPGKGWTARARTMKLAEGCKRDAAPGVGDDAFFESCPIPRSKRSAPLYVKVGPNDLILQLDVEAPATEASARSTLIAVAKAVVAKLK